jgi:hypothetical protein
MFANDLIKLMYVKEWVQSIPEEWLLGIQSGAG